MESNDSEKSTIQTSQSRNPAGLWQRVWGVLWGGPKKAFEDIIALPNTAGVVILLLILNLFLIVPVLPKIKEFAIWTVQNSAGADKMPVSAIDMAGTAAVVSLLIGSVLGPLLMWLIIAGLLKLFNSFSGEKVPYKLLFTVAAYSYLPVMLATIIRTALLMATPAQNFTRVSTSLALILPEGRIDRLYLILSQVDPFFIWSLALLVTGSSLAMKTTIRNTAVFIGVLWLIYVLAFGLLTPINEMGPFATLSGQR